MLNATITHRLLQWCSLIAVFLFTAPGAQDSLVTKLPGPQLSGGKPLMQALKERKSSREFSPQKLPAQELSNMLWAAFGVNRPGTGGRTAPSAMNMQEIDVYAILTDGLYRYEAENHALRRIHSNDIRDLAGAQPFVKDAPVNIILVADYSRTAKSPQDKKKLYANADAAFISENIYLYCASAGLATVVRARVDRETLAKAMRLGPDQEIIFAQTVGYPKDSR
ncbi:MAG: SagB/ThcOx family dehydrogenase [Chitinispirillaceae bacterium]|jgi:SagB-type dehydrogenase family enzyme